MSGFVEVASTSEIPAGARKVVRVGKREIALFNIDGAVYAIDNVCYHLGGPLGEGTLRGTVIACPFHGWTFDVVTGICTFNSDACVDTFRVKLEDGRILVEIT